MAVSVLQQLAHQVHRQVAGLVDGEALVEEPVVGGLGVGADHGDLAGAAGGDDGGDGAVGVGGEDGGVGALVEEEVRAVLEVDGAGESAPPGLDDGVAVVGDGGAGRDDVLVGVAGEQVEARVVAGQVAAQAEAQVAAAAPDVVADFVGVLAQAAVGGVQGADPAVCTRPLTAMPGYRLSVGGGRLVL